MSIYIGCFILMARKIYLLVKIINIIFVRD